MKNKTHYNPLFKYEKIGYMRPHRRHQTIIKDDVKIKVTKSIGPKTGVFVAGIDPTDENKVIVGFSVCNIDAEDKFERDLGLALARERALRFKDVEDYHEMEIVTGKVKRNLKRFLNNSKRYYKNKDFPLWTDQVLK